MPHSQESEILICPSHPEWDERLDDYREAVEALQGQEIDAQLADMAAPPSGSDLPDFIPLAFAVYVAHKVADAILAAIIDNLRRIVIARAKVPWRERGEKVKGVIYGPEGEVLHEFVFEAVGDDEQPSGQGKT